MSVFVSVQLVAKSKEAKKVTRLANKIPKATRLARKPGAVVVIFSKAA
jgi:hypothetical protein